MNSRPNTNDRKELLKRFSIPSPVRQRIDIGM